MNRTLLRVPLCLCLSSVGLYAQENPASADNVSEVHRLYLADQDARKDDEKHPDVLSLEATKKLIAEDKQRRERTRQIIDAGGLKTGEDYHDAAFIFQHGDTAEDYLLAHILASTAIIKGDQGSRWIAAATLDRYLQFIKQKQVFGTQYLKMDGNPFTQEPFDAKLLTDNLRQAFCIKPRSDLEKGVDNLNHGGAPETSNLCSTETDDSRQIHIGVVDFFGYSGLDLKAVQAAFPIHTGDAFLFADWKSEKEQIKQVVTHATGHEPTDMGLVCCNPDGTNFLFVGLQGKSSRAFAYNSAPTGSVRMPPEALDLYDRTMATLTEAIQSGDPGEDDSQGYALSTYPKLRDLDLKIREYALHHDVTVREVLKSSSDAKSREVAAHFLGYAQQSQQQIEGLVAASRDPDSGVRNNATRALSVLADSSPAVASKIPGASFVEMLSSGKWTDRNKGLALLTTLSASKNPELLAQLRSQALDALEEMARWRSYYALSPRVILARIAGLNDQRINDLTAWDPAETIIGAMKETEVKTAGR
ncbi:MAG TPA: conjugal transfer protein TraD [Candidatus Sulfotelmatobacter sp.]|nr:conjugal transfer protein TraD [Candidatus Sulfotelmatobacter sp.]